MSPRLHRSIATRLPLLAKAVEKFRKLETMALEKAKTRLDSGELERRIAEALEVSRRDEAPGDSSGSSPASSK